MVCASVVLYLGDYMSTYSDWKSGAITYEEYKQNIQYEARKDEYYSNRKDEYFDGDCFDGEDDDEDYWD